MESCSTQGDIMNMSVPYMNSLSAFQTHGKIWVPNVF